MTLASDRVIVIAAGAGNRWGNYGGTPKHFAPVQGEPTIARTVRLFADAGDIWIVGSDERYRLPGTHLHVPEHRSVDFEADRFTNSRHLWSPSGRTLLLLGDVWFSDEAAATIKAWRGPDWQWFCRFGKSEMTGCSRPEGFAFALWPAHHQLAEDALVRIVEERREGLLHRAQGWELYRAMAGALDLRWMRDHGHATRIDDLTQDFDYPQDYWTWLDAAGLKAAAA
ncbi:MAG: NTP transferase domain-containing protein [Candidatus Limnocylindrales bacterium]